MSDIYEPCPSCPWRLSSTVGGADIPGFSLEKMRRLENTTGRQDGFRPIMACHYSKEGKEVACRGYVAQEGYRNLNVRMLAAKDVIPMAKIMDACERLELWPTFAEMLEAYEEANAE